MKKIASSLVLILTLGFVGCGGGGGSSSSGSGSNTGGSITTPTISITTDAFLPGALVGQPYSITLSAANVKGAAKWSMISIPAGSTSVPGLTLDPATGVLSGTPTVQGSVSFSVTVSDTSAFSASQVFYLTTYGALAAPAPLNLSTTEFGYIFAVISVQGGVPPLKYSVTSGSLPPGISINSSGQILGSPIKAGSFSAMVTVQDSWKTPQSTVQAVDIAVSPPYLSLRTNIGFHALALNKPYENALYGVGGVPPYTYQITSGNLPTGLFLDANTGKIAGTPTVIGRVYSDAQVTDSAGTKSTISMGIEVVQSHGRNDSIQTATPIRNVGNTMSLSPYIDPPDKAPTPGDTDYYKVDTMAGSIVTIYTSGSSYGPIDTVIEVLDGNGVRLSTCHLPDDPAGIYTSPCINDEESSTTHNSSLDYSVPGTAPAIVTFYVHVLDWRGDARPDMQYNLGMYGIKLPIEQKLYARRGLAYSFDLNSLAGTVSPATWTLNSGTFPDGLSVSSAGVLSGIPATDGTSTFQLKAVDSATPPQTFYMNLTMVIAEPLKITSPAAMPTACSGKPYSFTVQTSGGNPPIYIYYSSSSWTNIGLNSLTGEFSGIPTILGTFTARVFAQDITSYSDTQDVTLTVQNCP